MRKVVIPFLNICGGDLVQTPFAKLGNNMLSDEIPSVFDGQRCLSIFEGFDKLLQIGLQLGDGVY